jgi:hypothetical protein
MTISFSEIQQDTIQIRNDILTDSLVKRTDSLSIGLNPDSDSVTIAIPKEKSGLLLEKSPPKDTIEVPIDTTSVCSRNSIIDFTFYNSNNLFTRSGNETITQFPFLFTERSKQIKTDAKKSLIKHLKHGQESTPQPLHNDWILAVVLIAALLYSLIRKSSKDVLPGISRFFHHIGINDPSSRNIEGLFNWQSTIHNLFSFLIIGLFASSTASYYNIEFFGISGIVLFLIIMLMIIVAVTLRHILCVVTGIISGEEEAFKEYLGAIYHSYRSVALVLFVFVILISYTVIMPVKVIIISGVTVAGIIYLIRIFRLVVIFMTNNISIFYLILYLCALEILPVLISLKYFAGLI